MKTFSGAENDTAGIQKARGCLATNLVMPGLGSLAGGRKAGLPQLALCLAGFALTLGFGLHFIYWALANWAEYYGPNAGLDADIWKPLRDMWRQARWPLLGMVLFAVSWLWALGTSRSLIAENKAKGVAG